MQSPMVGNDSCTDSDNNNSDNNQIKSRSVTLKAKPSYTNYRSNHNFRAIPHQHSNQFVI